MRDPHFSYTSTVLFILTTLFAVSQIAKSQFGTFLTIVFCIMSIFTFYKASPPRNIWLVIKARRCLVWLIGSDVRSVLGSSQRSAEPSATLKNQSGINRLLPSLAALGGPLHLFRLLLDLCSRFSKG